MTQFHSANCVINVTVSSGRNDLLQDARYQATQLFCLFMLKIKTGPLFTYLLPGLTLSRTFSLLQIFSSILRQCLSLFTKIYTDTLQRDYMSFIKMIHEKCSCSQELRYLYKYRGQVNMLKILVIPANFIPNERQCYPFLRQMSEVKIKIVA